MAEQELPSPPRFSNTSGRVMHFHPVLVLDRFARADADQHILHRSISGSQVMDIIRRDQRNAGLRARAQSYAACTFSAPACRDPAAPDRNHRRKCPGTAVPQLARFLRPVMQQMLRDLACQDRSSGRSALPHALQAILRSIRGL